MMKEMSDMHLKFARDQAKEATQRLKVAEQQLQDVVEALRANSFLPMGYFSGIVTTPYVVKIEGGKFFC